MINKAIDAFLSGKTGVFKNYVATKNALVYRTIETSTKRVLQDILALKVERPSGPVFLGNSSSLQYCESRMAFGNRTRNWGRTQTEVQRRLSMKIPMVPFSVFQQAKIDLFKINIIERGKDETVYRKIHDRWEKNKAGEFGRKEIFKLEAVHFTGASLFEIEGRFFLFDIDRREVKHKIFNPFLVELAQKANSISEAYEDLKPQLVKDAELSGQKVLRQGEWFFIPTNKNFKAETNFNRYTKKLEVKRFDLRAGNNRPNHATRGVNKNGAIFVSGVVSHSGREHADLKLDGWFSPVPNTSVQSFTITGDID